MKLTKALLSAVIVMAYLCFANLAFAGTMADGSDPGFQDDGNIPADLAGWFLNVNLSDAWSSAANIATMESWLQIVVQLGDDPSLLSELNGLGMIDPQMIDPQMIDPQPGITRTNLAVVPAIMPEPGTLELLGGALVMLGLYAGIRSLRADYVPIRRSD